MHTRAIKENAPRMKRTHDPLDLYAAIDLGSNTCRLLIAHPHGNSYKVIDSFSRIIRLGAGVHSSGCLSEDAMERARSALKECSRKLRKYKLKDFRGVATEACRQASNASFFLAQVREETGLDLEIITESEEASLALKGCMAIMDPSIPYAVVFDIGGCSTEVLWTYVRPNQSPEILDWISLPFGVVNLVEACGGDVDGFYEQVKMRIIEHLSPLSENNEIASLIKQGKVQMIGSSGTTTTIAAMHLDLEYYDRARVDGLNLSSDIVLNGIGRVRGMKPRERANHPCIGMGRSDLVISGLAILDAICTLWPTDFVRVADRGVRDGILTELIGVRHIGKLPDALKRIA